MNTEQRIRRIERWVAAALPHAPYAGVLHNFRRDPSMASYFYAYDLYEARTIKADELFTKELQWLTNFTLSCIKCVDILQANSSRLRVRVHQDDERLEAIYELCQAWSRDEMTGDDVCRSITTRCINDWEGSFDD